MILCRVGGDHSLQSPVRPGIILLSTHDAQMIESILEFSTVRPDVYLLHSLYKRGLSDISKLREAAQLHPDSWHEHIQDLFCDLIHQRSP